MLSGSGVNLECRADDVVKRPDGRDLSDSSWDAASYRSSLESCARDCPRCDIRYNAWRRSPFVALGEPPILGKSVRMCKKLIFHECLAGCVWRLRQVAAIPASLTDS